MQARGSCKRHFGQLFACKAHGNVVNCRVVDPNSTVLHRLIGGLHCENCKTSTTTRLNVPPRFLLVLAQATHRVNSTLPGNLPSFLNSSQGCINRGWDPVRPICTTSSTQVGSNATSDTNVDILSNEIGKALNSSTSAKQQQIRRLASSTSTATAHTSLGVILDARVLLVIPRHPVLQLLLVFVLHRVVQPCHFANWVSASEGSSLKSANCQFSLGQYHFSIPNFSSTTN